MQKLANHYKTTKNDTQNVSNDITCISTHNYSKLVTKSVQMITKRYQSTQPIKMNTKLRIIELLNDHKNGIHLRELSRLLKTGLTNVKRHTSILEKEGILKKQKDANLVILKLKNYIRTIAMLKQVHTEKLLKTPEKIQNSIHDFINELETKPLIALIFGSYSKGTYTKNSDLDILLVFQNIENPKKIENTATKIGMRTNVKINPIYVDYKNFEKNFLDKKHDFSKEIRDKIIIIQGVELYYYLLWRFLE